MSKWTIPQVLVNTVERSGENPGVWIKKEGTYEPLTWNEIYTQVNHLAAFLQQKGFQKGHHVAILSETRYEWILADLALQALGCISIPIYPTLLEKQVNALLEHSESAAIFISDESHLEKLKPFLSDYEKPFPVISFEDMDKNEHTYILSEALKEGASIAGEREIIKENLKDIKPDDPASIIYTSGTTGEAKGVILTHDNFLFNVQHCIEVVPFNQEDRFLSFLPLSHVLERMAGYYLPLLVGCQIAYAESLDTVAEDMMDARPTIMVSVPRLYEKIYLKVMDSIESGSPLKQKLFHWAVETGAAYFGAVNQGKAVSPLKKIKFRLADKLVLSKIRAKTGNRLRYFISGGAPLLKEIGEFFNHLGITILEGYGLTETSPVITLNPPGKFKFGTVGRAIPHVELKIDKDGEILTRSRSVMKGYYKNDAATAEAIDEDGWFHTGDIGFLDKDGFLKITDRKKNILVTSGGKNISPQPIEQKLKESPYIAEAVLIGDNRNYVTALIIPDFEKLNAYAQYKNIRYSDIGKLLDSDEIRSFYKSIIANAMRDFARYEQIKDFRILEKEFSLESGEYTPTLKVKRKIVDEKFKNLIYEMYASSS